MDDVESVDLEALAIAVARGIFSGAATVVSGGKTYNVDMLKTSKLRSVRAGVYTVIEQNPRKDSTWARLARDGHQIAWVFKNGRYHARVQDGTFTLLGKN